MARTKRRYNIDAQEETTVSIYRTGVYVRLSKENRKLSIKSQSLLETQESLARVLPKRMA